MFKTQKNNLKLTKGQYLFWRDMTRRSKNLFGKQTNTLNSVENF